MRRALGIAFLGFLAAGPCAARVLHVPSEYPTIAGALAAAASPDTVQLACGTYFERRLRMPAGVTLTGEPGDHCVVIDGTGSTTQGILQFLGLSAESTVRWVTFRNGRSHYGGAISMGGPLPAPGPLIEHCRFESNTANYVGGAVHASSGPLRIDSCEFDDNVAEDGGGAVRSDELAVSHCTFRRNRATDGWGGAIGASDGEVVFSTFEDNIAARSGGGISSWRVSIRDCTFRRNQAIWGGGASTSRTVERCLFVANTATHGGGLEASDEGSTRVVQCRFVENVATSAAGLQAVGAVIVESCTFLRNEAQSAAGCGGGASLQNVVIQDSRVGGAYGGSASLWNCNFHGNAGGDWVGGAATYKDLNGNFSADGLFCDLPAESLAVSPFSPLLAAHNPTGVAIGAESAGCAAEGTAILTSPAGLTVVVDGTPVTTPAVFPWAPGTVHVVEAPVAVETETRVRFDFVEWADGGDPVRTVTAGPEPGLWIARYHARYGVTMEADEHGTTAPQTGWFEPLEMLTIQGIADSLYRPSGWTGTGLGSYTGPVGTVQFPLRAPITQRAHFTFDGTFPLTMIASGGGSVWPASGDVHVGDVIEIIASTPDGFLFDGWVGVGAGSYTGPLPQATVQMVGPITQTANFHYAGYTHVTVQAFGNGTVTPPSGEYPREVGLPIQAAPAAGSTFYRWVGEGAGSYTGTERSTSVVPDEPIVQTAYFAEGGVYPLTVTVGAGGIASPASGSRVPGTAVQLAALPFSGSRFREWVGTGLGSYSGTDQFPVITIHAPITQHAEFEPDGLPHGYEFAISASPTDPGAVMEVPANGPRPLYLWVTCSEFGLSALEAGVQGTILLSEFTPAPGVVNVGLGSDIVLAISGCPQGAGAARVLGSWTALDTGGRAWLERSRTSGTFGAVDCGSLPVIWPEPLVRGFSSDGLAPVTGSNACEGTVSVVLTQLAAAAENRLVAVGWQTASMTDHEGFHVYRSDAIEGPFARLTAELLGGEGPHRYEDRAVEGDRTYFYKVGAVDVHGHEDLFGPVPVTTPKWAPLVTALAGVAPNPFRGATELRFSLAVAGRARLAVYDLAGRLVQVVQDGELPAGDHVARWDGRTADGPAAAGMYFIRFESGSRRETKRVAFLGASR